MCRLEEELDKDAVCHQFCLTCIANALPTKNWMGLETNIGGKIIHTVKYADDLVLMAKEEMVLQGMTDKVMKISRQLSTVTIMIDQKHLENVECFKYFSSMLTNDERCTCEIKSRIAMAKATFNKKKTLFTSTLDLNLRKKLVKCYK